MHNTIENPVMLQKEPLNRRTSLTARILLIILALSVIVGSGFIIFYATNLYPSKLHAQATAIVKNILATQARATTTNSPAFLYTQLTNNPPTFNNSLNTPMGGWDTGNIGDDSCTFTNGAYDDHAARDFSYFVCFNSGNNYTNFVFQVKMTVISGNAGGILIRNTSTDLNGYMFEVTTDGRYYTSVDTNNTSLTQKVPFGHSDAINTGLKQPNLLTVIARGTHLSLYINKQFITSFDDNTFSTGFVCLVAFNHRHLPGTDVAFNDAKLWIL